MAESSVEKRLKLTIWHIWSWEYNQTSLYMAAETVERHLLFKQLKKCEQMNFCEEKGMKELKYN